MRTMIRYAARSLARRPVVAIVLCFGLAVTLGLPIAIEMASARAEEAFRQRAEQIPLVLGAEGSANDLVFAALEFSTQAPGRVSVADWKELAETERAKTAPLFVAGTSGGVPVVGANGAYFQMRELRLAAGEPIAQLGDVLLGSDVARKLGVGAGGHLTTDVAELFSLSGSLPVRLNVVGRLAPTGTADDLVMFVNLETAWLISGLGHVHENPSADHGDAGAAPTATTTSQGVIQVTEQNINGFHFHGERESFPLTAVLARATSEKDRLWLVGHYLTREDGVQLAEADRAIGRLLERGLRIKKILDLVALVAVISTVALAGALVWLTVRLRWTEFRTMARLGLSRGRIAAIAGLELSMLLVGAGGLAVALAVLMSWAGPSLFLWVAS